MRNHAFKRYASILAILALLAASSVVVGSFKYPYPLVKLTNLPQYTMFDLGGVLFGSRRFAADIAWIQLLQYYGSPEVPLDKDTTFRLSWDMVKHLAGMNVEHHHHHGHGHDGHVELGEHGDQGERKPESAGNAPDEPRSAQSRYPRLLGHCYRVVNLDPYFSYAYLYGAGALAWNLERPDEAMRLLQSGISAMEKFRENITKDVQHPFWQYHLYMSAIIYRNSGEFDKMTGALEVAVRQPGCPNMVKAVLANIYQKEAKYYPSLKLWLEIYDSKDPLYAPKSEKKILELKAVLGI
ncbi:MAG: hypothetical protein JW803_04390 [Endomicrobiales bacterium]|nr:hypothetical protein [Endomicrobiales bacterium]